MKIQDRDDSGEAAALAEAVLKAVEDWANKYNLPPTAKNIANVQMMLGIVAKRLPEIYKVEQVEPPTTPTNLN